jgi:DNA-directed RNA polymerase subunit RPC12/RpoP
MAPNKWIRNGRKVMVIGRCSKCGEYVSLGKKPRVGETTFCKKCGERMVVVNVSPPRLAWIETDDGDTPKFGPDLDMDFGFMKYKG